MAAQKKVLIAYASAGHGHEKAALAILEAIERERPDWSARAVDTARLSGPFFGAIYKEVYLFQIRRLPALWGLFYYTFNHPLVYFFARYVRRVLNALTVRPLEALLVDEQPDLVIATHFQSIEIAAYLKMKGRIRSKLVAVVTDYLPHFVWTARGVDRHMVALEETRDALVPLGVKPSTVAVTGIPVSRRFLGSLPARQAREKLGLPDKFTVLLTSGGAGLGDIELIARGVLEQGLDVQLIIICGTNVQLYDRLSPLAEGHASIRLERFVDNMNEFMDASDLVIGKGGGITLTEAFVKGKPFILFRSVPGQEGRNGLIARKYGAGVVTNSPKQVLETLSGWVRDPESLEKCREGARRMARPNAASDIVRHCAELL